MLGLVRLGQIKLVHLGFQKVKKKSRKWVVAQMGCRAIEKSRKWDVAQMRCRAVEKSRKWDVTQLGSCADGISRS